MSEEIKDILNSIKGDLKLVVAEAEILKLKRKRDELKIKVEFDTWQRREKFRRHVEKQKEEYEASLIERQTKRKAVQERFCRMKNRKSRFCYYFISSEGHIISRPKVLKWWRK